MVLVVHFISFSLCSILSFPDIADLSTVDKILISQIFFLNQFTAHNKSEYHEQL